MPPKLDVETLVDLSSNPGFVANHLNHGAPLTVPTNATAFPWRNSAMLLDFEGKTMEYKDTFINRLLQDPYYDGNATKLQAYYNYLGPYTPDWRHLYFGDNYEKLKMIRSANDPTNVFGKPMIVEVV